MRHTRILIIIILAWSMPALAGEFAGLTPGRSTGDDAKRALGAPTPRGSALSFPGEKFSASEVLVQLDNAGVIQSISVKPADPPLRADMIQWLNLSRDAEAIKVCQKVSDFGSTPSAAAVHSLMGDLYFRARQYSQAADAYGNAAEIARDTPLYLYKKAQAAEKSWPKPIAALAWQGYLAQSEDDPAEAERRKYAQERLAQIEP